MWDVELDVVVAGAGGCGLVAALAAAEKDPAIEVAVFEKTEHILGNTAASAGMIPAAGTRFQREMGIHETYEEMAEDLLRKNHYESDKDLTLAICQASGPLVEWIVDSLGIEMTLVKEFKYPGQRNIRMHAPKSRSGLELIKSLRQKVAERENVYLMTRSEVTELIVNDDGRVIGVEVKTPDGLQRIKARKVILATNGFGANKQLVRQYIPEIAEALYFGYEGNTGDAIRMGEKVDADLSNLQAYQGHSAVSEAHGLLVTWGTIMMGGFMVNDNGERFGDESQGYSEFAVMVQQQPGKHGYIIFDQEIHDQLISIEDFKNLADIQAFHRADCMHDLAVALKIDPAGLQATLDEFGNSVSRREDRFRRTAFPKKLKPPFYGIKVVPALFHTQGGLKINIHAQVMNKQGEAIPNLYAGGGAAVGVSGNHAYGYMSGNGLLAALGFGKIAGDHAALTLLAERSKER